MPPRSSTASSKPDTDRTTDGRPEGRPFSFARPALEFYARPALDSYARPARASSTIFAGVIG